MTPTDRCWTLAITAGLLLGSTGTVRAAAPSRAPWTTHDLDLVADATTTAAITGSSDGTQKASALIKLADAMMQAGYFQRARIAALKAGSLLPPPTDFMTLATRGDVIQRLARLDDSAEAITFVSADASPETRTALLGKLGAGEALSGNLNAVSQTVASIRSLLERSGTTARPLVEAVANAQADIGLGLVTSGAIDAALEIAKSLPDSLAKVRLLSQAARVLCQPGQGHDQERASHGAIIAQQSATAATDIAPDVAAPFRRTGSVENAARAIAECKGAETAVAFLNNALTAQQAGYAVARISQNLTKDGNYDLARAILPAPNPKDPEELLLAAQEANARGDVSTARALATKASDIAVNTTSFPAGLGWSDHIALLGRIFSVLLDAGAYDQAIATVQPIELVNRQQYYVSLLDAEARHKDTAAVTSSLPKALEAVQASTSGMDRSAYFLSRIVIALAGAGYKEAAKAPFNTLRKTLDQPLSPNRPKQNASTLAEVQAAMGDVPAALATADAAGPLVAERNEAQKRFIASMAMMMGGARPPPTDAAMAGQLRQLEGSVETAHPGPKADALMAIALRMATMGDVSSAIQAEAGLEGEPRNALKALRDAALVAISNAQLRADDPEAALATALRISQPTEQAKPLLKLAALPPRH
jgi:hypothetical protein